MPPVTGPPTDEARALFSRLGYTVSGDGPTLRAERKWRTVHVTTLDADAASEQRTLPDGGTAPDAKLRCFVTWMEYAGDVLERLERASPSYDWAVVGVTAEEEYDVVSPSRSAL